MILQGRITEISGVVPKNVVINMDNPNFSQKEKLVMVKTTGIKQYHVGYRTRIMAINTCKPLNMDGVKMVICVTQTPDVQIPGLSNLIQNRFNLKCGTIDLNGACNGFVQGLMVAYSFASQGVKSLLVFSEHMTKIMEPTNKNSMLFGDGAVAMIVEHSNERSEFKMYADGSRFTAVWKPDKYLEMDGSIVFDFAMKEVLQAIKDANKPEIDYYVLHQSNLFILKQVARTLKIPDEKMVINIQDYGNTSAVSIPLAMVTEQPTGKLLACGYGAGLNWGTVVFRYYPTKTYYNEI